MFLLETMLIQEQSQGAPSNRIAIGAAANVTQNNTAVIGNGNVTQIWMAEDKGAVVYAAGVNVDGTLLSATIAALQADVDQNESDSDSADTTMQADIDGNEADADAAIAALQADVRCSYCSITSRCRSKRI